MKYDELKKQATPLPWIVGEQTSTSGTGILGPSGEKVFIGGNWLEDMQLAAHCVRHFDELKDALEYVVRWHREHDSGEGELFGLDFVTTCIGALRHAREVEGT